MNFENFDNSHKSLICLEYFIDILCERWFTLPPRGQNLKEIYRVSQTKPGHETGLAILSLGLSFVRVSGNSGNSECYGAIPQNETLV